MITALIIVDTRRETKNGYPLKIRVHDQIHPHRYLPLKYYQKEKTKEVSKTPFVVQREYQLYLEVEFCNKNNLGLEQAITIFKNGVPDADDVETRIFLLEQELNRLKATRTSIKLIDFYKEYVNEMKSQNLRVEYVGSVINKLGSFLSTEGQSIEDLLINSIDYEMLVKYRLFLIDGGFSDTTISTYFATLKKIFKEAQKRKSLNVKPDNPFDLFKLKKRRREKKRDLDLNELKLLINAEVLSDHKPVNIKYLMLRDILIFQFLIGGHDLVELSNLKWKNIKNGRISFYRSKNKRFDGGEFVDNMLHSLAVEIIEKYGTKDSDRVFSFIPSMDTERDKYKSYNIVAGDGIKRFSAKIGIETSVRTKIMRYTFNTIARNLLVNDTMLEKIQGHKNSNISHGYFGATKYEVQDAEHLKVIEYVFGEKESETD